MSKRKTRTVDPRELKPKGYYVEMQQDALDNSVRAPLFAKGDLLVWAFIVLSCLAVGVALWLKPPQLTYPERLFKSTDTPAMPAPLNVKRATYDPKLFEEVTESDSEYMMDAIQSEPPTREVQNEAAPRSEDMQQPSNFNFEIKGTTAEPATEKTP